MLINNIDIKTYKAREKSVDIQNCILTNTSQWLPNNLSPSFYKSSKGFKTIKVDLYFEGNTKGERLKNISNFMANFTKEVVVKLNNYSSTFVCILQDQLTSKAKSKKANIKTITLLGYEHGQEIIETMNSITSKTVNVIGNSTTPAIVEITPISDIIDITLEGLAYDPIVIKNLKANKKVILDGELQKVTLDGVNKFGDTDMWDFPSLAPGVNSIKVSRNNCNIKIKYKPRWI